MIKNGKYIQCKKCGKNFYVKLSKIGKTKFCSMKCFVSKITKKCEICNKKFLVNHYRRNARFCSLKCFGESRKIKIIKKCLYCNKTFIIPPYKNKNGIRKYCSANCFQKDEIGKNNPNWKGKIKKKCLVCDKEFEVFVCRKNISKFCSHKCYWKSRIGKPTWNKDKKCPQLSKSLKGHIPWNKGIKCPQISKSHIGEKNPAWKGGKSFEPYSSKFNELFKYYIREKFNNICQLCGKTEKEEGRNIALHHIDYNKKNNKENNFILLCASCNARVNANRDYWTKYFKELLTNLK